MKLSEMSTDKAMEVMANMIPALSRVADNPKVNEFLSGTSNDNGIKFFLNLATVLLRECKNDAAEVIGLLCAKTPEQVINQNVMVTMKDIMSCYDKELMDFFTSLKPTRRKS